MNWRSAHNPSFPINTFIPYYRSFKNSTPVNYIILAYGIKSSLLPIRTANDVFNINQPSNPQKSHHSNHGMSNCFFRVSHVPSTIIILFFTNWTHPANMHFKKDIFLHVSRNRSGFNAVLIFDKSTIFSQIGQRKNIFFLQNKQNERKQILKLCFTA